MKTLNILILFCLFACDSNIAKEMNESNDLVNCEKEKKLASSFSDETLAQFMHFDLGYRNNELILISYEFSQDSTGTAYYFLTRKASKLEFAENLENNENFEKLFDRTSKVISLFIELNLKEVNWNPDSQKLYILSFDDVNISYKRHNNFWDLESCPPNTKTK
ncbi:MAG TPA: hypothetical protein PK637_13410 [Flavobacteriales bacterium]|nr:hypothetical protein [Flavobacteriales bacterium]